MTDVNYPRLHKRKNTYYLRASYPADLLYVFKAKERWKSLGTTVYSEAVRKLRAASADFDAEMQRLRTTDGGPPQTLNNREIVRLCGKAYDYAIRQWEDQPGGPVIWKQFIAKMSNTNTPAELEMEIGPFLAELLPRSSTVDRIDDDTRERFLPALRDTIRDAATTLLRRANFDYDKDELAGRFGKRTKATEGYTLGKVMKEYMADPGAKRGEKTLLTYRLLFDVVVELMGTDKLVENLTREDCKRVRSLLQELPKNARKHYPNKALMEAAKLGKVDGKPLMSVGTINSYLINLSSLLNWAVKEEMTTRNPAKGLLIVDPVKDKNKRKSVPMDDLPKLFQMPLYTGCMDDGTGYAKPGVFRHGIRTPFSG